MIDPGPAVAVCLVAWCGAVAVHAVIWCAAALDAAWGPWRADHIIAPP